MKMYEVVIIGGRKWLVSQNAFIDLFSSLATSSSPMSSSNILAKMLQNSCSISLLDGYGF